MGTTDAIILRNDRCELPIPGASDAVQIEIIALNLVSTQPITVTFNGGQNPEIWDVRVTLSSAAPQQPGTMTVNKECCNGGTFQSTLPVTPKFIFTRPGDGAVRELDLGALPIPPIQFQTLDGHWSNEIPDPFQIQRSPGMVAVDNDLFPPSPDILIPPSSKFTPGFRTVPCDPASPDDPFCGGKVLTREQEMLAEHGVLPPQVDPPLEGACCLPDGSCIITTIECCEEISAGIYQGDFVMCQPDLCELPVFDTLCSEAELVITPSPTDNECLEPLPPIQIFGDPDFDFIVRRSPDTPYTAGQTIQTEMLQMELSGSSPLGPIVVRAGRDFGLPPSTGSVQVTGVDGSGNLTSGTSFFDVFIEITLPSIQLINLDPIPMEGTITALPRIPGESLIMPPSTPPILLVEQGTLNPFGYLCLATHTIVECDDGCCIGIRGDLNNDGADANILDLNFAVNRVFRGGPLPVCPEEGDVNSDGTSTNILDLNFLVNRVFRGGPAPGPC